MTEQKTAWKAALLGILLTLFAASAAVVGSAGPSAEAKDKMSSAQAAALPSGHAGGDACLACHDIEAAFKKNPHYKSWSEEALPWSERGCETCHGPGQAHIDGGGDTTQIFRFTEVSAQKVADKCLDCHLKQTTSAANFLRNEHGLNSVACTKCHSIHKPQTKDALLKARQPAICFDCHNEVRPQFNKPFHHRVEEGFMSCTDCHNQHGGYSVRQYQASTGNYEACFECHSDKQGPFTFEHLAVKVEGCTACHDPHASNNPRLLKRPEIRQVCLECHSDTPGVEGPRTPSFHNMRSSFYRNCTTCHVDIHGSNLSPLFFVD